MFKGLGNLGNIFKQAQAFGGQMEKLTEDLKHRRAIGTSGGGMVEIEVNGVLEVLRCKIDPQLFAQGDLELIEDLLVGAVNQAVSNGKQLHAAAVKEMSAGFQLPGLQEALEKMGGLEPPDGKA